MHVKELSADILGSTSLCAVMESNLEMGQMKTSYSKQLHAHSYTGSYNNSIKIRKLC
jgi:hypothetical protein